MLSDKLFSHSKYFMEHAAWFVLGTVLAPVVFIFSLPLSVIMACMPPQRGGWRDSIFCNFMLCVFGAPLALVLLPIAAATSFALSIAMGTLGTVARIGECCFCVGRDGTHFAVESFRRQQARRQADALRHENEQLTAQARRAELARVSELKAARDAKERASEEKQMREKDAEIARLREQIEFERNKTRQAEIARDRDLRRARLAENQQEAKASNPPGYDESSPLLSTPPTYKDTMMEDIYNKYFRREFKPDYPMVNATLNRIFSLPGVAQRPYHVLGGPLTDEQIKAMQAQLADKDLMVKRLFETAVMGNDIAGNIQEVMRIPVLLFGQVYDLAYLDALPVNEHGFREAPGNVFFKSEDIVPYNTLGEAISFLLRDIKAVDNGNAITDADVSAELKIMQSKKPLIRRDVLADPQYKTKTHEINMLEGYYQMLPPRHKKLFNIMCRCPLTGCIYLNPVNASDGYTYDQLALDAYRRQQGFAQQSWPCPNNTAVYFNESDIQKCNPICNIRDLLIHQISWNEAAGFQPSRPQRMRA